MKKELFYSSFAYKKISFNEKLPLKLKLKNGMTLIIDERENFNTVCISFYIFRGSRDELDSEAGFTHFCEHMIFKGTTNFNKKEIALICDRMGGNFNAFTTSDTMCVFTAVPVYYVEKSIELILEMLYNSTFPIEEIEVEKNVILNEIRGENEDPYEKVTEDFLKNFYYGYSLGRPISGDEKLIKNIKRDNLYDFYRKIFSPENIKVIISGSKINIEKIKELLENYDAKNQKTHYDQTPAIQSDKIIEFTCMPSDQVHVVLGNSKFDYDREKDFLKYPLFNQIFGESFSSLLFQKLRDELGLSYFLYSFFNTYRYEKIFGIYFSVDKNNLDKAILEVSNLIKDLKQNGLKKEIFENSKEEMLVSYTMNNDLLPKRITRLAFMEEHLNKIYTFDEIIKIIEEISLDDMNEIIKKVFIKENFFTQILYKKKLKVKEWNF